jgi:hypothetical protein
MGARGRVWMHVCAGLASGECRGKAAGSGCFGGAMTLNVFVIFWRFESQRVWNLSNAQKEVSIYAGSKQIPLSPGNELATFL